MKKKHGYLGLVWFLFLNIIHYIYKDKLLQAWQGIIYLITAPLHMCATWWIFSWPLDVLSPVQALLQNKSPKYSFWFYIPVNVTIFCCKSHSSLFWNDRWNQNSMEIFNLFTYTLWNNYCHCSIGFPWLTTAEDMMLICTATRGPPSQYVAQCCSHSPHYNQLSSTLLSLNCVWNEYFRKQN